MSEPGRKRRRVDKNSSESHPSSNSTNPSSSSSSSTAATTTHSTAMSASDSTTDTVNNTTLNTEKEMIMKGGRYHCNYCKKDISSEVRIKCAQCPDFDLCVDCFYVGVETASHKNTHAYRVMDDMSAPLYTSSWGADEELLLLEGIELFGLGNWMDIAEHVGTKNKFQCEYHYWSTYVDTATYPLPDSSQSLKQDREITEDDVKRDDRGLLLSIIGKENAVYLESEQERKNRTKIKLTMGQDVGFMPLRGDFDVEYSNNTEEYIADMEITDNDKREERELKLKMLRLYEHKLKERDIRKKFAKERGFIDFKKVQSNEKKKSKEEREIHVKYRPFARFTTQEKFEELVEGVIAEKRLRKRIEQLKQYRLMGITTLQKAEQYEQLKKKREQEQQEIRRKNERSYMYNAWGSRSRSSRYRGTSSSMQEEFLGLVSPTSAASTGSNPLSATSNITSFPVKLDESNITASELPNFPGAELLSQQEKDLCVQAKVPPRQYMLVKDVFVREYVRLGYLTKASAYKLLGSYDKSKISKLYDFFILSGWISEQHEQA